MPETTTLNLDVARVRSDEALRQVVGRALGLGAVAELSWDAFERALADAEPAVDSAAGLPAELELTGWGALERHVPEAAQVLFGIFERAELEGGMATRVLYRQEPAEQALATVAKPSEWAFFRPVTNGHELQVPSPDVAIGVARLRTEALWLEGVEQVMVRYELRRTGLSVLVPERLVSASQRPLATPDELARLPEIAAEPEAEHAEGDPARHRMQAVLLAMTSGQDVLDLARAYRDARRLCEAEGDKATLNQVRLRNIAHVVLADEVAFVGDMSMADATSSLEAMFARPE